MRYHLSASVLLVAAACAARTEVPTMVPDPVAVNNRPTVPAPGDGRLVESILAGMSVREQIGQLIFPWLLGDYASVDQAAFRRASDWVTDDRVGGILISVGSPLDVAAKLNALQMESDLPLLVAADLEWGTGMRLIGGTAFPYPMAIGATDREVDAYQMGRVTAEEARAVGIHMTFSPVADLNNNPDNPIINTRSWGEDPEAVSRLLAAYVRGAEEHGLYTTAKHFPGHGDTGTDSHIDVPVTRACWDRLDSLELEPFRAAIRAGVTAVMTAHIAVPCLNPDAEQLPATMSPEIMTGVLRDSLGFQGLVVTDALIMGAIVTRFGPAEAAVRAFEAGSDLLLMPTDVGETIDAMESAVNSGRISMDRLRGSVRRVLELKRRAGLFERRTISLDSLPRVVGDRRFAEIADRIAAGALTLIERGAIDEFRADTGDWALITYAEETNLTIGTALAAEMRAAGNSATSFRLYPSSGSMSYDSARTIIAEHARVMFASSVRPIAWRGHVALPDSLADLIVATSHASPTILVSLGSPYLLRQLPDFEGSFLLAWSAVSSSEKAVARAVSGLAPITGHTPITISEEYPRGFGIEIR